MIPLKHPHGGDCEHACCLKIEHLSVRFGGEAALEDVNLHMHCGQMARTAQANPRSSGPSSASGNMRARSPFTSRTGAKRGCASATFRRAPHLTLPTR